MTYGSTINAMYKISTHTQTHTNVYTLQKGPTGYLYVHKINLKSNLRAQKLVFRRLILLLKAAKSFYMAIYAPFGYVLSNFNDIMVHRSSSALL